MGRRETIVVNMTLLMVAAVLMGLAGFLVFGAVQDLTSSAPQTVKAEASLEDLPDWLPRETKYFSVIKRGGYAVNYSFDYHSDTYDMRISWSTSVDDPDSSFPIFTYYEVSNSSFAVENNVFRFNLERDTSISIIALVFAVFITALSVGLGAPILKNIMRQK